MTDTDVADLSCRDLQFHILGRRINVRCDDEASRRLVLANYTAFREAGDCPDLEYTVERRPSGGFCISRSGEILADEAGGESIDYRLVYLLEKVITLDLQRSRNDLYFVHASALERGGRTIIVVAESGTGKSTTAWALLHHGFHYLSDELAPIDPVSLDVHPYPHALCLKSPPPQPYSLPMEAVRTERTIHIPVGNLPSPARMQPGALRALLFLRRDTQVPGPTFAEVSAAEAGARLYANTLNALAHPGSGLDVAIRIASAVPAFRVDAGELRATCQLVSDLEQEL
jgi:hypothetical protein